VHCSEEKHLIARSREAFLCSNVNSHKAVEISGRHWSGRLCDCISLHAARPRAQRQSVGVEFSDDSCAAITD
jgi:hypothetical protein